MRLRAAATLVLLAAFGAAIGGGADDALAGQGRGAPQGGGRGPAVPQSPRDAAPIDLTGYWVSVVNEDWRWRMVTPPKGDYASVPLNGEGRKVADAWDPSQDGRCEAYGAAGIMRMPARLHITWEGPTVLQIEIDAGRQTRRLIFDAPQAPSGPRTLQGHSAAEWERPAARGRGNAGDGAAPQRGSLKVVTTHMTGGWLRRNGVPYSANAVLTEHFDRFPAPNGDEWLVVTSIVSDPAYLTQDFVTSTHFRKEADGSKFSAMPCRTS